MSSTKKENPNMALWDAVEKSDPSHVKEYNTGTFKGNAIRPIYSIKKATEKWGAMGTTWGAKELEHFIEDGVWFSKIEVWFPNGMVEQWGATKFKYGTKPDAQGQVRTIIDDEAAKKAYTDALTKCLSWLGFSADVHMGRFDDSKYVDELKKEFAPVDEEKKKKDDAAFANYKASLKKSATLEELAAFFKGAWPNIRMLPEDLVVELTKIKDEMKIQLEGK